MKLRAFTLLEVLIAGGILFVVSASVVGLSNSIIRGTTITNDATVTNRWTAEGLELVTKIRDERSKSIGFSNGEGIWFGDPADPTSNYSAVGSYGWHYLVADVSGLRWKLEPVSRTFQYRINLSGLDPAVQLTDKETLTSENLIGYRLICIESYGAVTSVDDSILSCNLNEDLEPIQDGSRISTGECHQEDLYCRLSAPSLAQVNKDVIIPDGNTVKIRSVVLWGDRGEIAKSDVATVLTNWRGIAN